MDNPDFFHLLFRLVGELHKQRLITAEEKSSIKDQIIGKGELISYILQNYDQNDTNSPAVHLKIVQCLREFVETQRHSQYVEKFRNSSESSESDSKELLYMLSWELEEDLLTQEEDYIDEDQKEIRKRR